MSSSDIKSAIIQFGKVAENGFSRELRRRINQYFKENKVKRHGDWRVYHKTIVWLILYLAPLVLILTGVINLWVAFGLTFVMGIAKCGIGLNVMHDANHGSYSKKGWVNRLGGATISLMGGNVLVWKLQHNVLHHSFTNIQHKDEDIAGRYILKFTPEDPTRWFHRFQHLYSPFLYSLMTLLWAFHKDFVQLKRYHKNGLIKKHKSSYRLEMWRSVGIKVFYFGYILVLPLVLTDMTWWQWLIGFLSMHLTAGLLLGLVFQSAHVVEETENPVPVNGSIEDEWMIHQLKTTANFGTKSKWLSWFAGGLNFQVEHHLFPNISHMHYPEISKIVRQCAKEFNLPYNEAPTFMKAIVSHFRTLKALGRMPQAAA